MRRATLLLLCLGGFFLFTALGIWQLERRVWKLDLIQRVTSRVHAPAAPAPGPAEWPALTRKNGEYRHVSLTGHLLNDHETPVMAVTEHGPGYWIMTPLKSAAGFTVLINRGFVPTEKRDPATRLMGQISGTLTITGLLRPSEPGGGFLRANQPAQQRWYSRDVAAIAQTQHLPNMAPYFVDADATPNPGGVPIGGLTVMAFPNNHLVYALTWFALAVLCGYAAWRAAREEN